MGLETAQQEAATGLGWLRSKEGWFQGHPTAPPFSPISVALIRENRGDTGSSQWCVEGGKGQQPSLTHESPAP